jgi:hypothetical protein
LRKIISPIPCWDTLDCYGQELDVTPNLDSMAKDGVKFEYAFALEFTSHGYDDYMFNQDIEKVEFIGYRVDALTDNNNPS